MSTAPLPPNRVPTLTEVVAWPGAGPENSGVAPPGDASVPDTRGADAQASEADVLGASGSVVNASANAGASANASANASATAMDGSAAEFNEDFLTQRVLHDLQRQIDLMLEYRMREVLTPMLTRAADAVIRDARNELASTLRDVVTRAVAQELARHRTP